MLANLLVLVTLFDMKILNSHTYMIGTMSAYQFVADLTFYFVWVEYHFNCIQYITAFTIFTWSSMSSAFVSNFMILSVLYVVRYRKCSNELTNKIYIHVFSNIIPIVSALLYVTNYFYPSVISYAAAELFNIAGRMLPIIINIKAYLYMTHLMRVATRAYTTEELSYKKTALCTLVNRLKYYPLGESSAFYILSNLILY